IGMMHATTGSTQDRNTPLCGTTATKTGSSRILMSENEVFSTGTQNVARSPISAASWIVKMTHSTTATKKIHVEGTPSARYGWWPVKFTKIKPATSATRMLDP